jgi:hypothetical protein
MLLQGKVELSFYRIKNAVEISFSLSQKIKGHGYPKLRNTQLKPHLPNNTMIANSKKGLLKTKNFKM